jgi:hypothetical protein
MAFKKKKKKSLFPKSIVFSPKISETIFPPFLPIGPSLSLPQSTSLSSGAHPLSFGEFFGHRRLSVPRSPSCDYPLSLSALTLSPPASSSATGEAIPPSLPISLTPAKLLSPSHLSLSQSGEAPVSVALSLSLSSNGGE